MKRYCVQCPVFGTLGSYKGSLLTSTGTVKKSVNVGLEELSRLLVQNFKPLVLNEENAEAVARAFNAEISETMLPLNPVQAIECPLAKKESK